MKKNDLNMKKDDKKNMDKYNVETYIIYFVAGAFTGKFVLESIFKIIFEQWYYSLVIGGVIGILFLKRKEIKKNVF